MRHIVFFGTGTLTEVLEIIRPVTPSVTNSTRKFIAADLDTTTIDKLRAKGYTVREDTQFAGE